jgi:putative nucleotidyltransferase with HDIG domain
MQPIKAFVLRHFELAVVLVLVLGTVFAILIAGNKLAFLNFFYIPTLVASYFLGRKQGVFVALAGVLMVVVYAIINPNIFASTSTDIPELSLLLWGAFIIVTAFVVGTLYEVKKQAVDDLREAYQGILAILAKFIDAVDAYTQDHSMRVSDLAAKVAEVMGLPEDEIENVRVAGLLHDIGKIDISLDVLRKASALSAADWDEVRTHTAKGTAMLRPVGGLLSDVVPLVECHHECHDGSGYLGKKGEEIPLGARILAVADSYDAMVCDRPYRTGRTPAEALKEVERCSGTQFDPRVVSAFKTVMPLQLEDI